MKIKRAIPFKIPKSEHQAIKIQIDEGAYFYSQLHYHPEFQITAILKGEGIFYAGNAMQAFSEKDVFVIGGNVPHLFKCSSTYYLETSPGVKGISIFFDEYSFGKQFFEAEEMHRFKSLLKDFARVIKVEGQFKEQVLNKIISTSSIQNEGLVITFLEILFLLLQADKTYLNTEQYNLKLNKNEGRRLNEVLDFTFRNYSREISIEQIAEIAFLSRSQFAYFFKSHTGKTYVQFLNALRIENACILLKSNNLSIEQICYEVGFQNVSNFVRQFKKVKETTPSKYRKSWFIK